MSEEKPQKHRLIVAVVIALGVLIVIAFAIIIGTIIYRLGNKAEPASAALPSSGQASGNSGVNPDFGNIQITIPAGYRVTDTDIDNGRLLVRLDPVTPGGAVRLLLFDLTTGARMGSFTLEVGPPP